MDPGHLALCLLLQLALCGHPQPHGPFPLPELGGHDQPCALSSWCLVLSSPSHICLDVGFCFQESLWYPEPTALLWLCSAGLSQQYKISLKVTTAPIV